MKAPTAKGKITQLDRSRSWRRASGPTMSYLKTRVRASRLYEAAFILAIAELTRRLHQAYQQAYDETVVGSVLPQKPLPTPKPSPHPTPPSAAQQKQFDDCVKPHLDRYWRGFKRTGGKAILGAVGAGVGIAAFGGAPEVGFGIRAGFATLGRGVTGTTLFHALSEFADGGVIGVVPAALGGGYMMQGLGEMLENRRVAERAVADCAKQFPNASHSVLP